MRDPWLVPNERPDLDSILNALEQGREVRDRGGDKEMGPEAPDDPAEADLVRRFQEAIESGTLDEFERQLQDEIGDED